MKVLDKFHIKGRGDVYTMTNDVEMPAKNICLRRVADGKSWPVSGVERFCMFHQYSTLRLGESIGMLLPDGCEIVVGDDVEVVPTCTCAPVMSMVTGERLGTVLCATHQSSDGREGDGST